MLDRLPSQTPPHRREPEPAPAPTARVSPTLSPAAVLALQSGAGNQAVARFLRPTLQRHSWGHPLANALGMQTDLMRQQLGEPAFQILTRWWRIDDLSPIFTAPAPILGLRRLAFGFTAAPMDELATLIRDLTPGLGVPAFLAAGLERARFLHRHRAQLGLAQAMLTAAGNQVARADALMQFLAPYAGDPAQLAMARHELGQVAYDIAAAAPVVAFLAPYAANPVALPVARQELATAAGQIATAQAELDVLAKYNYDRATRDAAKHKAQTVEAAELKDATDAAATTKQASYDAAELAETAAVEQARPEVKKTKTKTAQQKARLADAAFETAKTDAATTRAASELLADQQELQALATGAIDARAAHDRVLTGTERFIATVTASHDAGTAKTAIELADFDEAAATAVLPLFGATADARADASWALALYATRPQLLARAVSHLRAAAALPTVQAHAAVATLMALTISGPGAATVIALAGAHAAVWPAAADFLTTHYAGKGEDGATALQLAFQHNVPLADLIAFGAKAHVFTAHVSGAPAFFCAQAKLLRTAWPATHRDLDALCTFVGQLAALPAPMIELLVIEAAQPVERLRAHPAAIAHVLGAAAATTPDLLRGDLPFYVNWFDTLGQGAAGVTALVQTFPDVRERTSLIGCFTHTGLRTRLIAGKTAMAATRFDRLTRVVTLAKGFNFPLDDLETALQTIDTTFAADLDSLYDLLIQKRISTVPTAIRDAARFSAPQGFIPWAVNRQVGPADHFLGDSNAYHEFLAGQGAGLVQSRTIFLDRQRLTSRSGSGTDMLHVFDVTFNLHVGGPITAELHNHVSTATKRQTSLHFKHDQNKGPELTLTSPLAVACLDAVMASNRNTQFATRYGLS